MDGFEKTATGFDGNNESSPREQFVDRSKRVLDYKNANPDRSEKCDGLLLSCERHILKGLEALENKPFFAEAEKHLREAKGFFESAIQY
jgi:hypothetical protein